MAHATPLTFSYDALGRMTAFTLPAGNQVNYSYDANGNRTQEKIIIQPAFDPDTDNIPTVADNCSTKYNPNQADVDKDGKGDACDAMDWAQLITGYYSNFGNQDGITTEQLLINHGLTSASQVTSLNNYTDKLATNREVTGVSFDPNSNRIYFSETWAGEIRHVDLGTNQVTRDAGAGSVWLRGYVDGTGSNSKMDMPEEIVTSPDGKWVYISDYANCAIRRMNTATGQVTTYAGDPASIPCTGNYDAPSSTTYKDGPAATARFFWPRGVAVDTDGTVYVGDSGNHAVRKIAVDGTVSTVAGGLSNSIGMIRPDGIVIIGDTLYVADRLSRVIWKINKTTGDAAVVVGQLNKTGLKTGVAGNQSLLACPLGITGSGNTLFFTDDCNNNIVKVDIANNYTTTLLNTNTAKGFVDGALSGAQFRTPQGISFDSSKNLLYIGDFGNLALRRINLNTMIASTILGLPSYANTYVDGDGTIARFNAPQGMARIDDNTILVADTRNCLIRKITLDPNFGQVSNGAFNSTVTVSTFSGQASTCADWNYSYPDITKSGPVTTTDAASGSTAQLYRPAEITVDSAGQYAYVLSMDRTIRRMDLSTGGTHWIAGQPLANTDVDGVGGAAQIGSIDDVVYVDEPALYVIEDSCVRRIALDSSNYGAVTTPYGNCTETGQQDAVGTAARFTGLFKGIYLLRKGVPTLYVTDTLGNTVRQINLTTHAVTTVAGSGTAASVDGTGTSASFDGPVGITAVSFPGNVDYLYIGDLHTPKLRMIDLDSLQVTTISGSGNMGIKDGVSNSADWSSLVDMVYLSSKSRVFVLDLLADTIRQVTPGLPQ